MDNLLEEILKVTSALYGVSDLFPENDPLKFKIREKGLEILSNFTIIQGNPLPLSLSKKEKIKSKIDQNFEILRCYFQVAKKQDWLDEQNFLILEQCYQELIKKLQKRLALGSGVVQKDTGQKRILQENAVTIFEDPVPASELSAVNQEPNSQIQKRILDILKEKGSLAPSEFYKYFSEITPRAIRYHLKILKTRNLIEVVGAGPNIVYRAKTA